MTKKFVKKYHDIITVENLLRAWQEFLCGKTKRNDVALFQAKLMDNIFDLRHNLINKSYTHGAYQAFNISDPKPRNIHKATVRDRLLHHLLFHELYSYYDNKFIYDSYSCRINKGTHKAIYRFANLTQKISSNQTRSCFVLKCDIKKFFASINHEILKNILAKHICDQDIVWLLGQIIDSFHAPDQSGTGLPLGNLTSQLFVNIYMNEFDQFVKRKLKVKYYIRYADDFVILDKNKNSLENIIQLVADFLSCKLKLELHPDKTFVKTIASGVDFLGWVHFPYHRTLRTSTKKRMLKRVNEHPTAQTVASYLGMLKHGNAYRLQENVREMLN